MRNLKLSSLAFFTVIIFVLQLPACGSGGGGGGGSSTTTGTSAEEKIVGNFFFQYTISSPPPFETKTTIDTKTDLTTEDGTPIYRGFNAEYPSLNLVAVGAWYPSLGKYAIVQNGSLSGFQEGFVFVIEGDNRLTGFYYQIIDGVASSLTFALDSSLSKKYALGSWARSLLHSGDIYSEELRRLQEATVAGSQTHRTSLDNATINALAELSGYLD